jgi:hypothetical protein
MTDTGNVYKDFIRKLQGKAQLGKYRFRQDDINTEPGVSDCTTAQVESKAGRLLCSINLYISGAEIF